MNTDLIESYRGFGGVRLEDEIMIVEGGIEVCGFEGYGLE